MYVYVLSQYLKDAITLKQFYTPLKSGVLHRCVCQCLGNLRIQGISRYSSDWVNTLRLRQNGRHWFSRWHFQTHFLERKLLYFGENFIEICSPWVQLTKKIYKQTWMMFFHHCTCRCSSTSPAPLGTKNSHVYVKFTWSTSNYTRMTFGWFDTIIDI